MKRPGWQRRAIRASRAKGGSFRAEWGQSKIHGRAGRRRRLSVAAARPVETGGAPRSRAGVGVGTPLSDVSSDHWRTPCRTCRPTVGHRPLVAVAGGRGRAGSVAHPAAINTSLMPNLLQRTRTQIHYVISMLWREHALLHRTNVVSAPCPIGRHLLEYLPTEAAAGGRVCATARPGCATAPSACAAARQRRGRAGAAGAAAGRGPACPR